MMLEKLKSAGSSFVTLTYSDETMPIIKRSDLSITTLVPKDLQDFLKRFRKAISPARVRYYAVGEYGDKTWRPHYHIALFGYSTCVYGRSQYSKLRVNCCPVCDLVRDTWGLGFVYLGELEVKSAAYIAGYMMKKMTKVDDERLQGRAPEFARMSLRPGIGAGALLEVAQSLLDLNLDEKLVDVPTALRHGSKLMPLGRYLSGRLREMLGRSKSAPLEVLDAIQEELQPLWDYACQVAETPQAVESIFASLVSKEDDQKVLQMNVRQKLYNRRGEI